MPWFKPKIKSEEVKKQQCVTHRKELSRHNIHNIVQSKHRGPSRREETQQSSTG